VPIEAELKARLRDPDRVRQLLAQRGDEDTVVYADTYYDTPDRHLSHADRELRLRIIRTPSGKTALLTYKGAAVDAASGSKPETESTVNDAEAIHGILTELGFAELISFEKHCTNYRFTTGVREVLATVAYVPKLDETFIEVESLVGSDAEVTPALDAIRAVLTELGVNRDDETTETYTGAVAARRATEH
jgi:adenylate cyclase class 2